MFWEKQMFDIDFASSIGRPNFVLKRLLDDCFTARQAFWLFSNSKMKLHSFNMIIHFNCYNCIYSKFPKYHVLISLLKAIWI